MGVGLGVGVVGVPVGVAETGVPVGGVATGTAAWQPANPSDASATPTTATLRVSGRVDSRRGPRERTEKGPGRDTRGEVMSVRLARPRNGRHTGPVIDLTADAVVVAPRLLGCLLHGHDVVLRITEVEAYAGSGDLAAHAAIGPRPHTAALFAGPGTLYCYLSHGIHICGNIVCGRLGHGSAVLLRAGEVVAGLEVARQRRPGVADEALARGPGNLGRVMGWTLADSGTLLGEDGPTLKPGDGPAVMASGPRVGVSVAHQRPWRFWIPGDPTVSAYRRSPRAVADHRAW